MAKHELYADTGTSAIVLKVDLNGGPLVIPDAQLLFTADYQRSGNDLILTGKDGQVVIVEDYFEKADMAEHLHDIDTDGEGDDDIVTTINSASVYAEASAEVNTYLMKLSGVDTLTATAAAFSTAAQRNGAYIASERRQRFVEAPRRPTLTPSAQLLQRRQLQSTAWMFTR